MAAPVLDLAIIFVFFAGMLAIGAYHYSGRTSGYGFFVAGGKIGPVVIGLSYMATLFSMFTFLGVVGLYSGIGLSFTNLLFGEAFIVAILMPTLGYKFYRASHKHEHSTPGDLVAHRFGGSKAVRAIVSLALIGSMLIYLTVQYIGVGLVLEIVTDGYLSFGLVVLLMFLVGGIYAAIGGMRSVAITDTIQGVLLTSGLLILLVVIFTQFDPTEMARTGLDANPALGGISGSIGSIEWLSWTVQMFAFGLGMFLWPQLWVRTYTTSSKKGLLTMSAAMMFAHIFLIGTVGYFLALVGPTALESGVAGDQIAILFSEQYLPSWLSALVLTGGAAAALSTLDSVALVLGSIASHDLYTKILRGGQELSQSHQNFANRFSAFLLMGIGAFLVYFGPLGTIGSLLVTFGYPALVGIFPAVFLGMYWRGATSTAAVISTLLGVGIVLLQTVLGVVPTFGIYPGGWAFLIGLIAMVGISLVNPEPTDDTMLAGYDL